MGLARSWSVSLLGVTGHIVEVECDLANGLPGFTITGLPDASVNESADRVRAALHNSGEQWPTRRTTIGLSPATLPKVGSGFDVAIALSVLAADDKLPLEHVGGVVSLGELGLDGRVKHVKGVLPAVAAAVAAGRPNVVVSAEDAHEAGLVPGAVVHAAEHLGQIIAWLRGDAELPEVGAAPPRPREHRPLDLGDVVGHPGGRLALEVAAAGGHHLMMVGPPGCGKTMLAERLPGILPMLDRGQQLEVTAIHSVAGKLPQRSELLVEAPFRAPHHSATLPSLVGGGSGLASPGEISLAHHGVLFLDEAPEFKSGVLDALRQPLESGRVEIARTRGTVVYPARTMLVLAANPCRCASVSGLESDCTCTSSHRRSYLARLSGPFMDRIDIRTQLSAVSEFAQADGEETSVVATRVQAARDAQAARYRGTPWRTNSAVPGHELRKRWPVPEPVTRRIAEQLASGALSARGADRVLRVAWSVADICGDPLPTADHVDEALYLRTGA